MEIYMVRLHRVVFGLRVRPPSTGWTCDGWMYLSQVKSPLPVTCPGNQTLILNLSRLSVIQPFLGLMNKVRGLAPLSRGWMDETLAPVPLLRLPTCSVHGQGTQLSLLSLSANKACKCMWAESEQRGPKFVLTLHAVISVLYEIPLVYVFLLFGFSIKLAVWEQAKDEAR